jgi:hypothetical protein
MPTWTRLAATTVATAYHHVAGRPPGRLSRAAARKAELACPLGKLLLRGRRSWWWAWGSQGGRFRRNIDLMAPLTSADSTPSATARRRASRSWCGERRAVAAADRCHSSEKSPSADAV